MVLKRLTKVLRPKVSQPALPDGMRVYAIGDIHGRRDLLDLLLQRIEEDDRSRGQARTILIFLGDLVDRGPDSAGVIDRLIELRTQGADLRVLCGNHDEMFIKALNGDEKALRFLCRIGGRETILSYGVSRDVYDQADFPALSGLLDRHVPVAHRDFLQTLDNSVELGDYLFVHAGIRPRVAIHDQKPSDLRWIREDFLSCRTPHPRMVVHGHSISSAPDIRANRIGIDTGAFASGKLTAMGLERSDRWFLEAAGAAEPRWGILSD